MTLNSAAGFVALLDDGVQDVKAYALHRLNGLVDTFWAEISESVNKIEMLHEDSDFQNNKLAALVASKVYYHLGAYQDSLHYALCAEELFDVNASNEFVETIVAKCIDRYIALRVAQEQDGDLVSGAHHRMVGGAALQAGLGSNHVSGSVAASTTTSASSQRQIVGGGLQQRDGDRSDQEMFGRLEQVVNRMFDRCFDHKQYKQALGIALETRRLDMFERVICTADDKEEMLRYAFRITLTLVESARFRNKMLLSLVRLYQTLPSPDFVNVCQCLIYLDDAQATSEILEKLLTQSEETAVMAYQIAFDLYENAAQQFLHRVFNAISGRFGTKTTAPADQQASGAITATAAMETDQETTAAVSVPAVAVLSEDEKAIKARFDHLCSILSGEKVIELHLQFLIRNNKADLKILDRIKAEVRNSITHNATVLANGIMHCGTTSDQFLRDNLDWLGRAVNWAKFTATATLGVIHKGHEKDALKLMSAYLPKDTSGTGSMYTEGGGLYALGLIHANHGGDKMTEYLLTQVKEATAEPLRHGACLGLGLAAMGTARQDVYDQIKSNLYQDDAITGEAAGMAMGLVMLGSGSARAVEDLFSYAKETGHEKIIRGLSLGLALVMYGRQEDADGLIDTLVEDKDANVRWAGMATLAMAYCGTGNNAAIRRALHAAVSDTNDDVRRWAVTALGFLLFKTPEQVPALVSLLSESYNPHLRYGAAMAVGVACAGTALKEALSVLEPLLDDSAHFVRQGALIATSMLLMQQNAVTCPKSVEFRERAMKIVSDRHEDTMAKFGAILALGIIDAGGRNVTISLQTRTGNANMAAAVGLLVFQNFWFWYPLTNFISLAFTPTAVIALNKDLKMPRIEFKSNAKPSTFAYPPALQVEKEKKKEKVETAILSITAKKKKEAEKKQQQQQDAQKMEVDQPKPAPAAPSPEVKEVKEETKEPTSGMLSNPARVMRAQQRVLSLPEDSRYITLKPVTQAGILMVRDRRPGEEVQLVEAVRGHGPTEEEEEEEDLPEPEPPQPFRWTEDGTVEMEDAAPLPPTTPPPPPTGSDQPPTD